MRQFWNGNVQRKVGITVWAVAASVFALTPVCRAQAATENDGPASTQIAGQTENSVTNSAMVPARRRIRVARLSDVEGAVQILRGDQTQFPHAVVNMPLTQGSRVVTGADGRAEIEFEDGSVARITPNSSLDITNMQANLDETLDTTVEQLSGLVYYELPSNPRTPFKVIFNGRTAMPTVNSTFRINLNDSPQDLAVLDGRVQVQGTSDSYSAEVPQGKTIQFAMSGNEQYKIADWIAPNGFDDWNQQLDQEAEQQADNQAPAGVQQGGGSVMDSGAGWSDLDNSGGWYPLPGYGMVWQPYGVGANFDPYGNGVWADMGGGFGYSWISGYSWGWMPFNCGAWSYIGSFGWGWMPGAYGCGGFGYGGYGYGYGRGRWRNNRYPHTNIRNAPNGYRAPVAPAIVKGQTPQRMVRVGNSANAGMRTANLRNGHGNNTARTINFNGEKISPLHSSSLHAMTGANEPGGNRMTMGERVEANRSQTVNVARNESFGGNRAFGQHTSFGPHGSFGGAHSSFAGQSFHSGSSFHSGGMSRGGGFSGGGGGFHGGGGGGHGGGGGGGGGHSGR